MKLNIKSRRIASRGLTLRLVIRDYSHEYSKDYPAMIAIQLQTERP
jgi:hypothetical protein